MVANIEPNQSGPERKVVVEDIFAESPEQQSAPAERPEARPEYRPEAVPEVQREQPREQRREGEQDQRRYAPPPAAAPAPQAQPAPKSPELVRIENVLAENLEPLFMQLTPQQQMEFQQKGEETATKIEKLLQETKIKVREILSLIREWLKLVPGINKFFLEQEAKIKTDRLLNLREQKNTQK